MINRLKKSAAAILSLLLLCPPALVSTAWAEDAASVDAIDVGRDSVRISLSSQVAFKDFVTATPARLVIELPDTEYQVDAKSFAGQGRFLKDVRAGQFQRSPRPVARVVLDLKQATGYRISKDGSDLVVTLGGAPVPAAAEESPAPAQASSPEPAPAAAPAPAPAPTEASSAAREPGPEPAAASASASVPDAALSDAPAPPPAAIPDPSGLSTKLSSELSRVAGAVDAAARVKAAQAATVRAPSTGRADMWTRLPRDPVSLDFDNTDIQDILKLMAAKSRMNIIYGPDVSGALTLHLTNVPFSEAFSTILSMMKLTTQQVGDDVLRVLTPTEAQNAKSAAVTATKVIPLNYAIASTLAPEINQIRTAEGRSGTTLADSKTNSLIVTESPEGLISTEQLVRELDQRPKQVLIEAKLVEISLTDSLSYGIQWDYTSVTQGYAPGGQKGTNYIGTPVGPPAGATSLIPPLTTSANSVPPTQSGQGLGAGNGRGTGVNLPSSTVFGALTLGRIANNYFVNATLTAAAQEGKAKILSDPKVATLNNQPATINVTTQIPYTTTSVTNQTTQTNVVYTQTGITLTVTPTINADGRITLQINPTVSQPSTSVASNSSTGAPAIDSRNVTTTVLVDNGETIVIGGLISDSVNDTIAKIPILGDIPILGWLFKKKDHRRSRSELLIFVTSKIMSA